MLQEERKEKKSREENVTLGRVNELQDRLEEG
jgi:hypothetical protein